MKSHWLGLGWMPILELIMVSRELEGMDYLDLGYLITPEIWFLCMD